MHFLFNITSKVMHYRTSSEIKAYWKHFIAIMQHFMCFQKKLFWCNETLAWIFLRNSCKSKQNFPWIAEKAQWNIRSWKLKCYYNAPPRCFYGKNSKANLNSELLSLIWIAKSEAELLSLNFSIRIWIVQSDLNWSVWSELPQSESELFSLIWFVQSESELVSLIWIESDFLDQNWNQIYCHLFSFWL